MKLVKLECENCHKIIEVEENQNLVYCKHCGQKMYIFKDIEDRINYICKLIKEQNYKEAESLIKIIEKSHLYRWEIDILYTIILYGMDNDASIVVEDIYDAFVEAENDNTIEQDIINKFKIFIAKSLKVISREAFKEQQIYYDKEFYESNSVDEDGEYCGATMQTLQACIDKTVNDMIKIYDVALYGLYLIHDIKDTEYLELKVGLIKDILLYTKYICGRYKFFNVYLVEYMYQGLTVEEKQIFLNNYYLLVSILKLYDNKFEITDSTIIETLEPKEPLYDDYERQKGCLYEINKNLSILGKYSEEDLFMKLFNDKYIYEISNPRWGLKDFQMSHDLENSIKYAKLLSEAEKKYDVKETAELCIEAIGIYEHHRVYYYLIYAFLRLKNDELLLKSFREFIDCAKNSDSDICKSEIRSLVSHADTETGFTFLHTACNSNDYKVAEFLLKNGANPNALACEDISPMDCVYIKADEDKNKEELRPLLNLLNTYGAELSLMPKNTDFEQMGISKKESSEGCYIATAVYGSYDAPEVMIFRKFRDETLKKTSYGRLFIKLYYKYSPAFAEKLKDMKIINSLVKRILDIIAKRLKY